MITDVCIACDVVECGYRIVELADGRFAFVWGNVRAGVGDELPAALFDAPTADLGATLHDSYDAAEVAYRQCADALTDSGAARAGAELLSRLA